MTSSPFGRVYFSTSSLTWGGLAPPDAARATPPVRSSAEQARAKATRAHATPERPPECGNGWFMGFLLWMAMGLWGVTYGSTEIRRQMFRQERQQVKASRSARHGAGGGDRGGSGPAPGEPGRARKPADRESGLGASEPRMVP